MASLTTCLRKTRAGLAPGDEDLVVNRAAELRDGGMKASEAGQKAVRELLAKAIEQRSALRKALLDEATNDARLQDGDMRAEVEAAKADIGWQQIGGRILRDPRTAIDPNAPDAVYSGDVVGRTQWLGSDLWRNRPTTGGRVTETEARDAIDKALRGEPMNARQRRFVVYALDSIEDRMTAKEKATLEALDEALIEEQDARIEAGIDAFWASLAEVEAQDERDAIQAQDEDAGSAGQAPGAAAGVSQEGDNRAQDAPRQGGVASEAGLTLEAQTPADLKARAEREQAAAAADKAEQRRLADKAKADAERDEFALTGSDRPADVAAAAGQTGLFDAPSATTEAQQAAPSKAEPGTAAKVENFGQALPPARRAMAAKLDEALSNDDIATRPLSEIWPIAANDAIEDTFAAAVAHAARAEVPAKPRVAYKLKRWVESVKTVRDLAGMIVSGRTSKEQLADMIAGPKATKHSLRDWWSKVRLLEQLPREQWKRIGAVEERPEAFTYSDGRQVPSPLLRVSIDDKSHLLDGDGTVNGSIDKIRGLLGAGAPEKRMQFEIRGYGPFKVNKKGDPEYRPLMTFPTVKEARAALTEQYDGLVAAWGAVKSRDNITERDLRSAENRPRAGKDWRDGKDVTPEQFQQNFGFRGGEWGAWVQQGKGDKERQAMLNGAYDALMDLAEIVGVPPRAMSLNGTLGIAFGSRGSGWASAHFEPSNLVISLTKTRGAGALAHEWFHALDNYFSRLRRGGQEAAFTGDQEQYRRENFITHQPEVLMVRKDGSRRFPPMTAGKLKAAHESRKHLSDDFSPERWQPDPTSPEPVRPEVEQRFVALVDALRGSPMAARAALLDKSGSGYWSRTLEVAARAFESFVIARMHEQGYHNDFLVNVLKAEEIGKDPARYPYLLAGEVKPIAEAFDTLFGEMKTREDDAGNVAMFSRTLGEQSPTLKALSETDDLFAIPKLSGKTVTDLSFEVDPTIKVMPQIPGPGQTGRWRVTFEDGGYADISIRKPNPYGQTLYGFDQSEDGENADVVLGRPGENADVVPEDTEDVIVDASKMKQGGGGAKVYAIAGALAHNTGRIFIGDPSGLSKAALRRRAEQMLSLALRYGTTDFLAPHPDQIRGNKALGVPPLRWVYGDDEGNAERLIALNLKAVDNAAPDAAKIAFDVNTGTFTVAGGRPIGGAFLVRQLAGKRGKGSPLLGAAEAGGRTIARAAVWRALVEEARRGSEGEGAGSRGGILAVAAGRLRDSGGSAAGDVAGLFKRGDSGSGLSLSEVEGFVDSLRKAGVTNLNVAQSVDDLPADKRDAILAREPSGRVRGAFFRDDGSVWLVADNLRSVEDVAFVVNHEVFHRGLAKTLGAEAKALLRRMYLTNPRLNKLTRELMERHKIGEAEAIEEALGDLSGEGKARDLRGWDKLLKLIRDYLAKIGSALGFEVQWTDDMIEDFVAGIRREGLKDGVHVDAATDSAPSRKPLQTMTAAFRRWFGDSKVVDENGEPLVVYHGTTADLSAFDLSFSGSDGVAYGRPAIFATDDARVASDYARNKHNRKIADAGRAFQRFKNENPGLYNEEYERLFDAYKAAGRKEGWDIGVGANVLPLYMSLQIPLEVDGGGQRFMQVMPDAIKQAAEEGRDGLIVRNVIDHASQASEYPVTIYIAFRPEQIKSAIGNNGSFDPENPDIRLSRAPAADATPKTERTNAQSLVNARGGVFDFNRLGETKQDRIRSLMDGSRPFWLGALTRDQLADVYGAEIQPVKEYDTLTRKMENQRSKLAQDADQLYSEWAKLDADVNTRLAGIMLDATVFGVHPDQAFDARPDNDDATEAERRMVHGKISAAYRLMPADGKAMYRKVLDFHTDTLTQMRNALEGRIERQVENGAAKQAALTQIRVMFDKYLENGPYFPLSRFGDFLVVADRADGERVVAAYESAGEQQAAARALRQDGFKTKLKTAKTYSRETDGSAGKFIGDVLVAVDRLDMEDATVNGATADLKTKLLDDLNQMFIKSMPDLSYRKHFLHRKGTPGFSSDVMRGFASSAFHAASHIARLNHGDKMTFALQDAYQAIENADEGDFNLRTQVLNELTKRHDAALNPNTHPIASLLNQLGFVSYLGLSPAAGLVNLLQTPMVTLPYLGARYAFGKASAAMAKATKDIMSAKPNKSSGWNAAQSHQLTPAERSAMAELQDEGVIDLTQAHDLASATGLDTGNVARSKAAFAISRAMKIVGWTFHVPEVMNRQVTALSAYRLEMEKSGDTEKAKEAAREAIKRTHFDYSSSNRARYMQGNVARVVLQFKQYAQNMSYLLGRCAQQALKGETPEVRSIARRQLVATLAATFGMAGTLGLPGIGAVMGLIGAMVSAMDDEDPPWDWKAEFRNLAADHLGKEVGEVIAHGIPRALLPWDLSNRVGMGDMWLRSSGREGQNPREAFASDMTNILGPTAGTLLGWYTASDHMARGDYTKAAESIVPKFLRDAIQAGRFAKDGITSYTGEPLMDTTGAEELGKLLGFSPARAAEMYEARNAVMNAKTAIEERRQRLLSTIVKARIDRDGERASEIQADITEFNRRNPQFAITSSGITASMRNKLRNRANTEDGIMLPPKKDYLRERGRFAETVE